MPNHAQRTTSRLVAAVVMVLGLLLAPNGTSASHDPAARAAAEALRHGELATLVTAHGHVHDDGLEREQRPGHAHGHNPADHSHVAPGMPPGLVATIAGGGPDWPPLQSMLSDLGIVFRFERPPKPIFAA